MVRKEHKSFNPLISLKAEIINQALKGRYPRGGCSEQIIPMINDFFEKLIKANLKWDEELKEGSGCVYWLTREIIAILPNLAENTRNYEKLDDKDIEFLKKIFDELYALFLDAKTNNLEKDYICVIGPRINHISDIVKINMEDMHDIKEEKEHSNWREGMVFQNYQDLWKIIHRINTEWEDLWSRGYNYGVIYDYKKALKRQPMSEEKKFETFMALLDGKMKFVPVYCHEYRLLGFKVLDNDAEDEIIQISEEKSTKSFRLRQKVEETTQCDATKD